jgi:hypothetical protein
MSDGTLTVRSALDRIAVNLRLIQEACEEYGGWAGEDDAARRAVDLGHQLESLAFPVGVFGREYAEGG